MTVIPLIELDPADLERIGGKAAGLAVLIAAGERVPAGFCLTTDAFEAGRIPREEVEAAYAALGEDVPVAVRSSATAEDLPGASFAGQQDTLLDVTGLEDLLAAIETCWASLDSERALAYRAAHGIEGSRMAVVVQTMIAPQAAGVLFTANPLTGTRGEMVVDAAPGSGAAVVDGTVDADHYVLGEVIGPDVEGCLDRAQLTELRSVGRRIQEHVGAPQDIEWAYDADGVLWLLQSRAITSLFPLPASDPADGFRGAGAAPGRATGRARVITDPRGARIDPGEILVAPTTDPGWTPLFLTAAGLVTETGAAMAHGPTVAREYGIPAVICVQGATTQIRTGQLISIDGASGTVSIE